MRQGAARAQLELAKETFPAQPTAANDGGSGGAGNVPRTVCHERYAEADALTTPDVFNGRH